MATRSSPTVRRRLLSLQLRRLREARGWTSAETSKRVGWPASKLTRIERNEWRLPKVADVETLLDLYEVVSPHREQLLGYARDARRRGWWYAYPEISDDYSTYIGLEMASRTLRNFEPLLIPGLLQTEEYALALMAARRRADVETVRRLVEVRLERQRQVLTGPDAAELWAVVDEAALHRMVGGPWVMAEQLRHLASAARLPNVRLGVVPFLAGATMGTSPFMILSFADGYGAEVGYLETGAGPLWVETEAELTRLRLTWEELLGSCLSVGSSIDLIEATLARIPLPQRGR